MLGSVAVLATTRAASAARLLAFRNSCRPSSSIVPLIDLLSSFGSGGRRLSLRPSAFNHSAQYHGRSWDGEGRRAGAKQEASEDYDDDDDDEEEEVDDADFSDEDEDDDMPGGYDESGDEELKDEFNK